MKLIKEIFENGQEFRDERLYNIRRAVRAIVYRDVQVALIHVRRDHFYKLPGGGVDEGENMDQAFKREMREELGYQVQKVNGRPFGATIEYRHSKNLVQMSYIYLGFATRKLGEVEYTEKETAEECEVVWANDLADAVKKVATSKPITLSGKFIKERDSAILKAVLLKEVNE